MPPSGPMDDRSFRARQPRASATPRAPPAWSARSTDRRCASPRRPRSASPGRRAGHAGRRRPCRMWEPLAVPAGRDARRRRDRRARACAATCCVARRHRRARATSAAQPPSRSGGFGGHGGRALRAGDVLRPATVPPAAGPTARSRDVPPGAPQAVVADRRSSRVRTPRRSSSPTSDIDALLRDRVGGALQLGPHRRAARRPAAAAGRATDGGEAGLHPSNIHDTPYCGRGRRLHRRHADPARPRRPEPRRLRLPGHGRHRRALEARPAAPGRHRALRRRRRVRAAALRRAEPRAPRAVRRAATTGVLGPIAAATGTRLSPTGAAATTTCSSSTAPMVLDLGAADAGPRPRRRGCSASGLRRDRRSHARASARCRSTSTPTGCRVARRARRSSRAARGRAAGDRRPRRASRGRSTCRCPGTTRRRARRSRATWPGCATTRPGARGTSSSSAASTAWTRVDDVRRTVFDAEYLVLGLGDVYLGAPVATPLDPAPPAGHHQVQPGAHLDARRTPSASAAPTCASTGWRGRAATSSSAARCRCGAAAARPALRAGIALAAALLRPHPLVSGRAPRSCSSCAPTWPPAGSSSTIDDGHASASPTTWRSSPSEADVDRRLPGHARRPPSPPNARRWAAAGEFDPRPEPAAPPRPAPEAVDAAARADGSSRRRSRRACGRSTSQPGDAVAAGQRAAHARGDEDGDRGRRAGARRVVRGPRRTPATRSRPGSALLIVAPSA